MRFAPLTLAAAMLLPTTAFAEVAWVGDFETGDLSQWNFVLNGTVNKVDYAVVQTETIAEGTQGVRIELHNDAAWGNGLKRVELQHAPEAGRTAQGQTTFFAWSFYLPQTLPVEPGATIGYWETNSSFQQMMAFQVSGERMTFSTRRPDNVVHWDAEGVATAEQWHRIAMSVTWSTNPGEGVVDVWYDGEQVVTAASAQTLADGNPTFVQVGLLRGAIEFDDVPTIFIDHAIEGDSLEDVEFDALPGEGGTGSSSGTGGPGDESSGGAMTSTSTSTTSGGTSTSGGSTTTPPTSSTTAASTSDATASAGGTAGATAAGSDTDTDTDAAADGESDGCGCRSSGAGDASGIGLLGLLAMLGRRRQRGRRMC